MSFAKLIIFWSKIVRKHGFLGVKIGHLVKNFKLIFSPILEKSLRKKLAILPFFTAAIFRKNINF